MDLDSHVACNIALVVEKDGLVKVLESNVGKGEEKPLEFVNYTGSLYIPFFLFYSIDSLILFHRGASHAATHIFEARVGGADDTLIAAPGQVHHELGDALTGAHFDWEGLCLGILHLNQSISFFLFLFEEVNLYALFFFECVVAF